MRFDDDASQSTSDVPEEPARARRRSTRPWSNPAPADAPGGARGVTDSNWGGASAAARSTRPPAAPPVLPPLGPTAAGDALDLTPVITQLAALQAQVAALQTSVDARAAAADDALTGAELAEAIESLGTALGGGMATLLTEHRNLLARDVTQAADRILEEVGVRLRAASTQTADTVEERVRHIVAKALSEMSEQVELRLDKVQGDVAGLRAVMLELPDQSAITERLDSLAETVAASGSARPEGRSTAAVSAAVERSVSAPLERLEEELHTIVDVVRELLEERLPVDLADAVAGSAAPAADYPDADAIAALTREMTALRRRISLRTGGSEEAPPEPAPEPEPRWADEPVGDDEAEEIPVAPRRKAAARTTPAKKAPAAAAAKAPARGRRSRRIEE